MKFIDEAIIEVRAGHGGAGMRHFRREKFIPFGGPDGGDGGTGGSVIVRADRNMRTLLDFQFNPKWEAQNGERGGTSNRSGHAGEDIIIRVPVGTQIFNVEQPEPLVDLDQEQMEFLLAKGGRGGRGNAFFKSATNQAPQHCQPGEPGQDGRFRLSLKLLADVGLIGFPNAGKSTLISRISAARPKIADYPFTTLEPQLGVVAARNGGSFVVADIPGLIEGAHEGRGLGIKFLKHVERAKVLAHLIDVFQPGGGQEELTVPEAFELINHELASFSPELAEKQQIVVLTKCDLYPDQSELQPHLKYFADKGIKALIVSSVSGNGIQELIDVLHQAVRG